MVERSGGSSQIAHLTTAAIVALVLLFFTGPLQFLPHCVLGAVVFTIAIGLVDFRGLREIAEESPGEFRLAITTAAMVGSPELYSHKDREPEQSVNFVTCHDGFTLNYLVSTTPSTMKPTARRIAMAPMTIASGIAVSKASQIIRRLSNFAIASSNISSPSPSCR